MTPPTPNRIRFEAFEADLRTEELFKSGRKIRLSHQSFRVLSMLLARPGQLVTREELCVGVWPQSTSIEHDQGLNAAVNRLREALRDSAEAPQFIETLPKRGYRFIAEVQPETQPSPAAPDVIGPSQPAGPASGMRFRGKTWFAAALSTILLIAVTIAVFTHHSGPRPSSARQLELFTSLPGQELAPTFSPDGSQIAFAWNGEGSDHQFDLYVKSLGSERLLRLTHQPSKWITPAWSPDGSAIAFVRGTQGEDWDLFVIPALGGPERRIVSSGLTVGPYIQISWSPQGRELAYSGYAPTGVPQIYIASLDSLQARPLSPAPRCLEAAQPAFSPDGKHLALTCSPSAGVYAIYVVGWPEGPVRPLATMMGDPQGLAWSADSSRLIFSNDSGDGGELWQVTLSGELTQLPFGESGTAPALAMRGGRMAYVHGRKTIDIWRADLTAAHPEESATKLIYSTRSQLLPRYSPDGTRIAFQSNRSGSTEIWITDSQGADPDRLTSFNGAYTSAPIWCSDGRQVAFDSRASGASAIYIEDIRERVPRKVTTTPGNLSSPAWSPDCRWLIAHNGNGVLYRFSSAGGRAERFTEHPSTRAVVIGDRVVFNVLDARGVTLWIKPAGGGPEAPLENLPKLSYSEAWFATVAGVYYTHSTSAVATVNFYDFATRNTRTLMRLPHAPIPGNGPGISVSPDGRWLLYSHIEDEQSDIMLAPAP